MVGGDRCPLGRERGICTRWESKPCLSLVVGGGCYFFRHVSVSLDRRRTMVTSTCCGQEGCVDYSLDLVRLFVGVFMQFPI